VLVSGSWQKLSVSLQSFPTHSLALCRCWNPFTTAWYGRHFVYCVTACLPAVLLMTLKLFRYDLLLASACSNSALTTFCIIEYLTKADATCYLLLANVCSCLSIIKKYKNVKKCQICYLHDWIHAPPVLTCRACRRRCQAMASNKQTVYCPWWEAVVCQPRCHQVSAACMQDTSWQCSSVEQFSLLMAMAFGVMQTVRFSAP